MDYEKLLADVLASDKSEEYKLIMSLLETDYGRFTYGKVKINETLALKLNEIKFKDFRLPRLIELARNLRMTRYSGLSKQELIKKIELVKKQFCNESI